MWWLEIAKNAMKTHRIIMFDKIKLSNSNLVEKLHFEIPNIEWRHFAKHLHYLGFQETSIKSFFFC